MSKDLEREYKALVNSEVPDLWARIEAGLEEKATPGIPEKKIHWKLWAGLAAACVCVALAVPSMTRMMRMGSSGSGMSASNDTPRPMDSVDMADDAGQKVETAYENYINTDGAAGLAEEAAAEERYYFMVTVEILDTDVRMDSGILYTAKVIASENPDVQAGGEIKIFGSAVSPGGVTALENSQTYDLMLCEDDSDNSGQETTYILANE